MDPEFAGVLDAIALCRDRLAASDAHPMGRYWLERTFRKLTEEADRLLTGATPLPSTEQGARQFVQALASALRDAGYELDQAAIRLKDAGCGYAASRAKQAAGQAKRQAEAVVRA